MKTQLYRHYNSDKKLLYVGISLNAAARLAQHRDAAHWFEDITDVKIETFPTREDALAAERLAIINENPVCNTHHKQAIKQIDKEEAKRAAEFAQKAARQLMVSHVAYRLTYKLKDLPNLLGMTAKQLNDCVKQGLLHTFEVQGKQARHPAVVMVSGWALIDFVEYLEAKNACTLA